MDTAVCVVLLPEQDVLYYTRFVQLLYVHLYVGPIINVHLVRRMHYCNSQLL